MIIIQEVISDKATTGLENLVLEIVHTIPLVTSMESINMEDCTSQEYYYNIHEISS